MPVDVKAILAAAEPKPVFGDDVSLLSDGAVLNFGADKDVTITHNHNVGLIIKGGAADDGCRISLQTGETTVVANDRIADIDFKAIDEASGTDAILVAARIRATAEGTFAADNNATKLQFFTAASENATEKMSLSSVGNLTISAGNIVMGTSGKGIDFSATADGTTMSSELLDDYEEGTWNPIITDGTNDASGYSTQAGNYIKIGTLVFASGNVQASNLGSVGGVYIGGLPFASKAAGEETYYHGSHHIFATSADVAETTSLHMGNNVTVIDVYRNITQTGVPHFWSTSDEVDTGTGLRFNMTYVSA